MIIRNAYRTKTGIDYGIREVRHQYAHGGGTEHTTQCTCDFSDYWQFAKDLIHDISEGATMEVLTISESGAAKPITTTRIALNRSLSQAHPKEPHVYASDVQLLSGAGRIDTDAQSPPYVRFWDGPSANDGAALSSVVWRNLPYAIALDSVCNVASSSELHRYVTRSGGGESQSLPIQGTGFKTWPRSLTDGKVRLEALPKQFGSQHWTYTWRMVPRVPRAAFTMMGCVNETAFDNTPRGNAFHRGAAGIGTVHYTTFEQSDPYQTRSGVWVVDITYHFRHRGLRDYSDASWGTGDFIGWNHVWCPSRARWERVSKGDTAPSTFYGVTPVGQSIYGYAELHNLFRLDSAT